MYGKIHIAQNIQREVVLLKVMTEGSISISCSIERGGKIPICDSKMLVKAPLGDPMPDFLATLLSMTAKHVFHCELCPLTSGIVHGRCKKTLV